MYEQEERRSIGKEAENEGKLHYELAVEALQLTRLQRAVIPLHRLWTQFRDGGLQDLSSLGARIISPFGSLGGLLREEVTDLLQELRELPWTTRELWRSGAFSRPFQESAEHLLWLAACVKEDFLCNWAYTARRLSKALNSRWSSRPYKFYVGGLVCLSLFTIYHHKLRPWPRHNTQTELSCLHKTVVITGSSAGIGYQLAFEFAKRGAFVILTSPDMVKARKARVDLSRMLTREVEANRKKYFNSMNSRYLDNVDLPYQLDITFVLQNIVEVELDLASTASVYSFSRKVQGMSPDGIDILINNASVNVPPEEMVVTDEGKEVHFAVNYYGHFVLTHLLLGLLAKRRGARIINVTCKKAAESELLNLNEFIEPYLEEEGLPFLPAWAAYANSKLAIYFFNRQLSKELALSGIRNLTTYCVCPGACSSTFLCRQFRYSRWHRWRDSIAKIFHKPISLAVQPILHCALSPKTARESGFFYENNRRSTLNSLHPHPDQVAQLLWTASMALMGVGHQPMLKLTEQMHILSHENIFQMANNLFIHRRDVMTHLLLEEEKTAFKRRHRGHVDERGDARADFNYFWHGFYLTGGENSNLIERWLLTNAHPGFRELQKEYDVWFGCTGSTHYYPKSNGKMAGLQYMSSMVAPLTQDDIEQLEELYESDSQPDEEFEDRERFHEDYIRMEEFIDPDY